MRKKSENAHTYTPPFELFWQEYPSHIDKRRSYGCWKARLAEGITSDQLTTCAGNYAAARRGEDQRYTMHPATFLGPGRRWEEFLEAKKKGGNGHKIPQRDKKSQGWIDLIRQEMGMGPQCQEEERTIETTIVEESREQVAALLSYMNHVWANAKESSTEALDVWTGLLEDLPFRAAQQAIKKLAMTKGPFAPSPWEIRQAALAVRSPLAIEAHDQAIKAIGTLYVFSDGWQCEMETHPLARKALELFGVIEFSEANPEFARPQYMKIYESLLKRAEEDALLPLPAGQPALIGNVERANEARAMIEALAKEKGMP